MNTLNTPSTSIRYVVVFGPDDADFACIVWLNEKDAAYMQSRAKEFRIALPGERLDMEFLDFDSLSAWCADILIQRNDMFGKATRTTVRKDNAVSLHLRYHSMELQLTATSDHRLPTRWTLQGQSLVLEPWLLRRLFGEALGHIPRDFYYHVEEGKGVLRVDRWEVLPS